MIKIKFVGEKEKWSKYLTVGEVYEELEELKHSEDGYILIRDENGCLVEIYGRRIDSFEFVKGDDEEWND